MKHQAKLLAHIKRGLVSRQWIGLFAMGLMLWRSPLAATEEVKVVRAAIDIGMGGPKLQIAEVDPKANRIVNMLHSERFFVNFYHELTKQDELCLSLEGRREGLKAFKDALAVAHSFHAEEIVAIGAAAFRLAGNGEEFAKEIQDATGVKVHIIDQTLEGKLAFQAVLSKMDVDPEHLVVWDIGGGSVQFIGSGEDGAHIVDCSVEGSGAFRDFIVEAVQGRKSKEFLSPNPMSMEEIAHAERHARRLSQKVDRVFLEKISSEETVVVGAGSVFGFGIAAIVEGKNPFSIEDLKASVSALAGKTDADLGGDYAFCEGSNAILVLGYMKGLNMKQMHIVNINNADGALIYESFWKE
ncbi:MAG: hypothetical protein JSR39_03615 [Verrucomicrobia bacterium]|nr:hypothetical protein [Verrucomicrobiota bacterium]